MWIRLLVLLIILPFVQGVAQPEERKFVFGLQVKPIIPSNFFRSGSATQNLDNVNFEFSQQVGFAGGMVIRYDLNRWFSIESGINYVNRSYKLSIKDDSLPFLGSSEFSLTGYEIPLQGLLYIRLGKLIYMNTAFGVCVDMFTTNISTRDYYFNHLSLRYSWINLALTANVGFEYRSKKSGSFYLGASFHMPFWPIYRSQVEYDYGKKKVEVYSDLNGNYLTLDLRYFFHEDPEKRKSRKQRRRDKKKKQGRAN